MATFVLVHGAWHGSWCWKRVRKALQARGHEVFTPTLTGVAERSHLLSPHVNLDTHIEDVVNLIRWEDLSGVVLCGHSYGGSLAAYRWQYIHSGARHPHFGKVLSGLISTSQGQRIQAAIATLH